jgi:hypothetical protein
LKGKPSWNRSIAGCNVFSLKVRFNASQLASLLLFLSGWDRQPVWLVMDRTNWKFGSTHHNLLIISVQIGDTAIPLIWKALGKAGNSSSEERIALMKTLLRFMDKSLIKGLLADREFIGEKWLSWLQEEGIGFVTRLKGNMVTTLENGGTITLAKLFADLRENTHSTVRNLRLGKHLCFDIQAKRTSKGLVITGSHGLYNETGEPVNIYRKRWTIECGFACLKRKGFNLEDTHLIHAQRLETLMGIVAIAFAWTLRIGLAACTPKRKNHGYNANCRFTIGKQLLVYAMRSLEKFLDSINCLFQGGELNHAVV